MPHYDIEIDYTTGDSFNSERVSGESVGITTQDACFVIQRRL